MGIFGWIPLQDEVTLVGHLVSAHFSGGPSIDSDADWNLIVQPEPEYEYLAQNTAGNWNAKKQIECEIQINSSKVGDRENWTGVFQSMVDQTVEITGLWCEDLTHSKKTEIHPIRTLKSLTETSQGSRWQIHAYSNAWSFMVAQPSAPPGSNQNLSHIFKLPWPPSKIPGLVVPFAEKSPQPSIYNSEVISQSPGQWYDIAVETGANGYYIASVWLGWTGVTDGMLVQAPYAGIFVTYGRARFHIPDMTTFNEFFPRGLPKQLPEPMLESIPLIPADGTLLREQSRAQVYVVEAGRKQPSTATTGIHLLWDGALAQIPS